MVKFIARFDYWLKSVLGEPLDFEFRPSHGDCRVNLLLALLADVWLV